MYTTRRSFLVGAGALITAPFLNEVAAFVSDTKSPLLLSPEQPTKTIYYEPFDYDGRLHRLHLCHSAGPCQDPDSWGMPEPGTVLESLQRQGELLTPQEIERYCASHRCTEEDLNQEMDEYSWECRWEEDFSTEAQAYRFLDKHNIFPTGHAGRREGAVRFEAYPNPMSLARWVEVHDAYSLSLLQARLNELSLGVAVREMQ